MIMKNGQFQVCTYFRNLNLATSKNEYVMPIVDMLVDVAAIHRVLTFMDGHSRRYNKIFMEEDIHKMIF